MFQDVGGLETGSRMAAVFFVEPFLCDLREERDRGRADVFVATDLDLGFRAVAFGLFARRKVDSLVRAGHSERAIGESPRARARAAGAIGSMVLFDGHFRSPCFFR